MEQVTLVGAVKSGSAAGFEGWASTNQLDRQGDIVLPSAFQASLPAFKANGPIFWNHAEVHDPLAMPIGRTMDAEIKEGGLYIKARWASTPEAQQVRSLVTDGIVSTMSIGFNPISSVVKGGVNYIDQLELMEVSVVAIPANTGAVITAAKTLAAFNEPAVTKDSADDVGTGAQILALLAQLKDEEADDPTDAAILQRAIDAVLEWLGTEADEIGSPEDQAESAIEEAMPTLMSARRIARLRKTA
jgi:HK97 family phage prohead protease